MSLTIVNYDHYLETIKFAKENGSIESLEKNLEYLAKYGCKVSTEEDPVGYFDYQKVNVTIYPGNYNDVSGFDILWEWKKNPYIKPMNGGLVYFKSSNDWSVHT